MTKQEKIDLAWEHLMARLASLNMRAPDAKHSPTASRFVLADAKELVGDAAVLMVLLHLDDAPVAVEAGLWEWVQDAPDHWSAEVEHTSLTMAVWPDSAAGDACWHYEVFDGATDQDEPVHSGTSQTFDGACKSAEKQLALYELGHSG
jgi:hypothetical protein